MKSSLIKQIKKESSSELSFLCFGLFSFFSFFELSFIGWNILAALSLGIGFLWLSKIT